MSQSSAHRFAFTTASLLGAFLLAGCLAPKARAAALTWTGATADMTAAANWGGTLPAGNDLTWDATGTTKTGLTGTINGSSYVISGADDYAISGVLQGAGAALTKEGSGTLTLSGINTFTGPVNVNAGILTSAAVSGGTGTGTFLGGAGTALAHRVVNIASGAQVRYTHTGANSFLQLGGTVATGGYGAFYDFNISGTLAINDGAGVSQILNSTYNLQNGGVITHTGVDNNGAYGLLFGWNGSNSGNINVTGTGNQITADRISFHNGATLTTNAGAELTITSIIGGSSSNGAQNQALIKAGAGTLILTGANTYTGATRVNGGTLQLDFAAGGTSNIISASSALVLGGGTLEIKGGSGEANTQTVNGVSGGGTLRLTPNGATSINLTLGAIAAGSVINFVGSDATVGALGATNFLTSTTTAGDDGSTRLGASVFGNTWASTSSTGGNHVVAWTGSLTDLTTDGNASNSTGDLRITGGSGSGTAATYSANTAISSLLMADANNATTVALGGNTLTVNDGAAAIGAIAIGASSQSLTIGSAAGDGVLTAGGSGASTLVLNNASTVGSTLTVNAAITDGASSSVALTSNGAVTLAGVNTYTGATNIAGGTLEFSSAEDQTLSGAVTGAGALVKSGAGTLTLTGVTSYTGGTTIDAGTLKLDFASRGAGPQQFTLGTLAVNSTLELHNDIEPDGTYNTHSSLPINTTFTGTGTITKTGQGIVDFFTGTNLNGFTGLIHVKEGLLGDQSNSITSGTASLKVDSGAFFDLRTTNVSVNELTGEGFIASSHNNPVTKTLTVGALGGTSTFDGIIQNQVAATYGPTGGGGGIAIALTKAGAGTLTLTGANSYTGATTVTGGKLQIGAGGTTGAIASAVSLASGATVQWYRSDTSQLDLANNISSATPGSGTVSLRGDGTADVASQYRFTGNNSNFSGTLSLDGGRLNADHTTDLGTATVVINANGQLLASASATYANHITVNDSSGWRDTGFRLGAIRLEGNSNLSGNIVLNQANHVVIGDNSGTHAVIAGYSTGNHDLSGVISGTGDFSMSRRTAEGGGTAVVNITLSGTSSNTYTGTTVVDGQGTRASLILAKTGGAVAINGGTTVQMGSGTGGEFNLRMGGNEQFGTNNGGVVMNFVNASGQWGRFDLRGTTQTLAGLNAGTVATQGGGVIQNREFGNGSTSSYGGATLTLNGSGTYIYNGHMRNVDGGTDGTDLLNLVWSGTGTQTLAGGVITYTGTTTVNAGTLALVGTTGFTSTATINDGGTLKVTSTQMGNATVNAGGVLELATTGADIQFATARTFSGDGTLRKTGAGRYWLSNHVISITGTLDIQGGTLSNNNNAVNWSASTADATIASGAMLDLYADGITLGSLNGAGTVTNGYGNNGSAEILTVGAGDKSGSFSGIITQTGGGAVSGIGGGQGALALTKIGAGTQTLSGANSYRGATTVTDGTLVIKGVGTGSTNVNVTGGAQLTTSAINVSGGALAILDVGAGVKFASANAKTTLGGDGTIRVASGLWYLGNGSGAGGGSAVSMSAGGLIDVLSGATLSNDYSNAVWTANQASLNVASGGTMDVRNNNTLVDALTGGGMVTNSAGSNTLTVGVAGGGGTFSGVIQNGTGIALIKTGAGTQVLSGTNTYGGTTTVSGGILQIGAGGASGTLGSGAVTNNAVLAFNRSDGYVVANAIGGTGTVNQDGAGVTVLSGASNYTGATNVNAGTLRVTGTLTSAVTVASGATLAGTGSTTGTIDLQSGSAIMGGATGASFQGSTVTTSSPNSVTILGNNNTGAGTFTMGVVRHTAGSPTLADFNTAGYRSATLSDTGTEVQLQYTAAARTWDPTSGTWAAGTAGWQEGDFAYFQGDVVTFGNGGAGANTARTVTLNSQVTPGGVTFNNDASNQYTVTGTGGITGTTGLTKSGVGLVVLETNNSYTGTTTINGGTLEFSSAADQTLSGAVTGAGALVKSGAGTLTLTGITSHTGGTTVDTGTLKLDFASRGAGAVQFTLGTVAVNSTLELHNNTAPAGTYNTASSLPINTTFTGAGTITKTGQGIVDFFSNTNLNGFTGLIHVKEGLLGDQSGGISSGTASLKVDSGAFFDLRTTNVSVNELTGEGFIASSWNNPATKTLTVGALGGTSTFDGIIQNQVAGTYGPTAGGIIALTKAGAGTLTLTNANTYTGTTAVNQGVLNIRHNTALGGTGTGTSVASGAALELQNNITVGAEALGLNGTGVGNGGALRNVSGNNTYNGAITLNGATRINSDADLLTLGGGIGGAQNLTFGGAGNTTASGAVATGSGSLTKDGAGTLTFSGAAANTYTGLTTVSDGTLALNKTAGVTAIAGDGDTGTTDILISGGTLRLLANEQIGNDATIELTTGTFDLNGRTETISRFVNNGGTFATGTGQLIGTGASVVWNDGINTVNDGGSVVDRHIQISGGTNTVEGGATGGVLRLDAPGAAPNGLEMSNGATLTLNSDAAVAGKLLLNGDVSVTDATTNTIANGGVAANRGNVDLDGGPRTFTIAADGTLNIGADVVSGIAGGALTKEGDGTLALSGANTYTGATAVNDGTLLVNGTHAAGAGAYTVGAGGRLGGSGSITTASLTVAGQITGGDFGTVDTLAISAPTVDLAGTYLFDVDYSGMDGDLIRITGAASLDLSGSTFEINELNPGDMPAAGAHYYIKIFESNVANGGTAPAFELSDEGLARGQSVVTWDGGKTYYLVPEPASFALLGMGCLLLLRRPTRRRGRAAGAGQRL